VETARKIWFRRNKWIHDGLFTPPNEVSRSAHAAVKDYQRCNDPKNEEEVNKEMEIMKWTRPPQGWYKINCDVAIDTKKAKMGVGLILRDHNGGSLLWGVLC
jgi:hypothetical protein